MHPVPNIYIASGQIPKQIAANINYYYFLEETSRATGSGCFLLLASVTNRYC